MARQQTEASRNTATTFIRFVAREIDHRSGRRQGLLQAAKKLRESGALTDEDAGHLTTIRDWFNQNLEKPTRLAISSRSNGKAQAISWFKDTATTHIEKMRELQEMLERHGIFSEMVKSKRPGYILYEDEFQVAAYPFSDTTA